MLSYGFTEHFHLNTVADFLPVFPFVFFTTLLVYTGQRYYKIYFTTILADTPRIVWMKKNKTNVESILAAALIGVLVYGLPLAFASKFNFSIIAFCALVSILYVVKIGEYNLREIPGIKVFLITCIFMVFVFLLPFQNSKNIELYTYSSWRLVVLFVCQYFYILGITILFDIPDAKSDNKTLKTLAQIFGERRTVLVSIGLILPFLSILFLSFYHQTTFWFYTAIHVPFYFFLMKSKHKHFYLALFGEGVLGLLGLYYLTM